MKTIDRFLKEKRKVTKLTQQELAYKAGVALTVIRKIEQRKRNMNMEKVNQVLKMFGHVLAPVSIRMLEDAEENKTPIK